MMETSNLGLQLGKLPKAEPAMAFYWRRTEAVALTVVVPLSSHTHSLTFRDS
jgi:hypothetical protein